MRNRQISGTELTRAIGAELERLLPRGWDYLPALVGPRSLDSAFHLRSPDKVIGRVALEVKDVMEPRMVEAALSALERTGSTSGMVIAPYIGPEARAQIARSPFGYGDATGNLRVMLSRPGLFIETTGASKNPWREDRLLASLKGAAAGAVVRAVCDTKPPFGVRELVARAELSLGTVSRVLELLDRDAIITRDARGVVIAVDWATAIRRWSRDYDCLNTNVSRTYLDPRGLPALTGKLSTASLRHAVTGSIAAARHAPVAATRQVTLYVEDAPEAAAALGLKRVETGGNVLLVEPRSPVVFARTEVEDGITYAAPSQVAADLLTAPGRGPAEAEALLAWMEAHEPNWRT